MKTDIEIARETKLKKIVQIADGLGIKEDDLVPYGKYIAKVPYTIIDEDKIKKHKLILVTAITPTKAGFGMKGGAAGGGYAQVLPMEEINLHFTGDFHAITTAHNMISALVDNYNFRTRGTPQELKKVIWNRVLDVNDRSLRKVITGLGDGNGVVCETGFDITPASEIMAIFCLATGIEDLRRRIEKIIVGYDMNNAPVTVKDIGVAGSIVVLLKNALNPNLVQTTENTPAFIHGGPFANIAHGCNSIIATKTALTCGDYVITEAGFAADLKKGLANLDKHIENMKKFGQTVIVALNKYGYDTDEELAIVREHCEKQGVGFAVNSAFGEGGKGAEALAKLVVEKIDKEPSKPLKFVYDENDSIKTKIEKICKEIYGAASVTYEGTAEKDIEKLQTTEAAKYPVCIAKTQYSFSSDPKLHGVPTGFEMHVREVVLNNGSEIVVPIMGDMMRMPGLPKEPQAIHIDFVNGHIEGLS